jgi:acyl-CoA synthetase (AMP-forming)/AMP-acid ligase II
MPSPKSGKAGSLVAPKAPETAEEADEADPGKVTETKAEQRKAQSGKYGKAQTKPFQPADDNTEAKEKTFIAIKLKNPDGSPAAGEPYEIVVDGEAVASGTLNDKGEARVDGLDPQTCKVRFPRLDAARWEPG